jgi:hypothetical protein
MTVAPGLLDRRLSFYARTESGADGFQRPTYVLTGTYWGRLDDTSAAQQIPLSPQAHQEQRYDAAATVMDYVAVPVNGIVRDTAGPVYFVRGIVAQRALRQQKVTLERIDPTHYGTYTLFDPADVADGVHLVTTPVVAA